MLVFIDTNILLSFYHFTSDDLDELRKLRSLVQESRISLTLPSQVDLEFQRNRSRKVKDSLERLEKKHFANEVPELCKPYEEYSAFQTARAELERARSALVKRISDDARKQCLKADLVVSELLGSTHHMPITQQAAQLAQWRVACGNPPGKRDSLGDALNWEVLLEHCPNEQDLHFVSADSDFASVLEPSAFNEFLSREWEQRKGSRVTLYRTLSSFFRSNFPNIKLVTEVQKELAIEAFTNAPSYSKTHETVEILSRFRDFTADQVDRIAQAALANTQIRNIISDPDVREFLCRLIRSNEADFEPKTLAQVQQAVDWQPAVDEFPN